MKRAKYYRLLLCVVVSALLPSQALADVPAISGETIVVMPLAKKADLVIENISFTPKTAAYTPIKLAVTIKNRGNESVPRKVSLHASITSVDYQNNEVPGTHVTLFRGGSADVMNLRPNEQSTIYSEPFTLTRGGRHKIWIVIDMENRLSESQENKSNNYYSQIRNITLLRPDLVVCFKQHNNSPPHAKSVYPVRVKNIGSAVSPKSDLRFRIQKKGVKHYTIPPLAPGQEHGIQRSVYWASRRTSNFSLRADSREEVREANENNNLIEGTICTDHYCLGNTQTICSDAISPGN